MAKKKMTSKAASDQAKKDNSLPIELTRSLPSDLTKSEEPAKAAAQCEGAELPKADIPGPSAAAYRWHAVVVLVAFALAACHFARDELTWLTSEQGLWDFRRVWSSKRAAYYLAWLCQASVAGLAFGRTAYVHGRVKSWSPDAFMEMIACFGLMSLPVSWVLAYLYCRPAVFYQETLRNGESPDAVMAILSLLWAWILTLCCPVVWNTAV
eukprot:TRINITY_DN7802_c0_g2_i3.p1 TRINITY_DN7802_c0_g2~~TRINITY_DN7802_c0_g2_i3.p1  ORF type:complete len:210 (+),score=20.54 TRINITY_DN7802_c0_g2_i3:118-747(+)